MSDEHGYIHRGTVLALDGAAHYVEVPVLGIGLSLGPMLSAVPGLVPGDAVLVSQIGVQRDVLAITSRVPGRFPDQSEIPGLAAIIAGLQDDIADLSASGTTADARLDALEATVGAHTTELASHETRIAGLEHLSHQTVFVVTLVSTGSVVYTALGSDDISLTMPYPLSGKATVIVHCAVQATVINVYGVMSFEIRDTNATGTLRKSAIDDRAAFGASSTADTAAGKVTASSTVTGLPTSGTMFLRAMYRSNSGSATARFSYRGITVIPSP
jgi:hypothetical protein